jgi:hypothetical protein
MRRFPVYLTVCAFLTAAPVAVAGLADVSSPACDGHDKKKESPDKASAEPLCDGHDKKKESPDKA